MAEITDTALTLGQINQLFQLLTMQILGLDYSTWNAYQLALTAIKTAAISAGNAGTNYHGGDVLDIPGGTGGTFVVDTVDGIGVVLTGHIGVSGTGYAAGNNIACTGGHGAGLELNIAVNTWVAAIPSNPYYNVRIEWPPQGAPAWKPDENVVFIGVVEEDDPINRPRDDRYSDIDATTINQATSHVQVDRVSWVFYGPNSYANARAVANKIFTPAIRNVLAQSGLHLVPDAPCPRRIPEDFAGQWWERVDFSARFNELVTFNTTVNVAAGVAINVTDSRGTESTIQGGS